MMEVLLNAVGYHFGVTEQFRRRASYSFVPESIHENAGETIYREVLIGGADATQANKNRTHGSYTEDG